MVPNSIIVSRPEVERKLHFVDLGFGITSGADAQAVELLR